MSIVLFDKIDLDKSFGRNVQLDEYRTSLQDDEINFMNLADSSEIKYINYSEVVEELNFTL